MTPADYLPGIWTSLIFAGIFISLGVWLGAIIWRSPAGTQGKREPGGDPASGFEGGFEGSPAEAGEERCAWCGEPINPGSQHTVQPEGSDQLWCDEDCYQEHAFEAEVARRAEAYLDDRIFDDKLRP